MPRSLRKEEIQLIQNLLSKNADLLNEFRASQSSYRVKEQENGGMGSLEFIVDNMEERKLGKTVAEAEYKDQDGVPVMVSLNLDSQGNFFELDIWKVDFSDVKQIIF